MKSNAVKKRFLFISSILFIALIFTLSTSATSFAARNFTVTTNHSSYTEHSTVRIRLTNTGTESLRLVNMWWMVEVRSGGTVREVYTGDPQKPPDNWDELVDFAKKLMVMKSGEVVRWGVEIPLQDQWLISAFIMQNGGNMNDDAGKRTTLTTEEAIGAS